MKRHLTNLAAFIYVAVGFALPVLGAPIESEKKAVSLCTAAKMAFLAKDFARAVEAYKEALMCLSSESKHDIDRATVLTNLGAAQAASHNYIDALSSFQQALTLKKRHLRKGDPSIGATVKHMAALLRRQHRDAEADKLEADWERELNPAFGSIIASTNHSRFPLLTQSEPVLNAEDETPVEGDVRSNPRGMMLRHVFVMSSEEGRKFLTPEYAYREVLSHYETRTTYREEQVPTQYGFVTRRVPVYTQVPIYRQEQYRVQVKTPVFDELGALSGQPPKFDVQDCAERLARGGTLIELDGGFLLLASDSIKGWFTGDHIALVQSGASSTYALNNVERKERVFAELFSRR